MITTKMLALKDGAVGTIVFNNPERRNAVSLEMWEAIPQIVDDFENDDAIRAIVVTGAGNKAFVSGADISEFKEKRSSKEAVDHYDAVSGAGRKRLANCTKPTIAMISGFCKGGGLSTALVCDLRIASDDAQFGIPAAKLGVGYKFEGLLHLFDVVGPAYALEILYTARRFTAPEALRMGLVNQVVAAEELEPFVRDYCDRIAENAPLTLRSAATIVRELRKDESTRDLALCERVVDACFSSQDYIEGQTAFMEKRKPVFTGR
jgi:enoyl-CoA hydratase/carnithine racemase